MIEITQEIYDRLQNDIDKFKESIQKEINKDHNIDAIWKQVNQLYILDFVECQIDYYNDLDKNAEMLIRLCNDSIYKDQNIIEQIVDYIRIRTEYYDSDAETDSFECAVSTLSEDR